jgi:hypothetical protein
VGARRAGGERGEGAADAAALVAGAVELIDAMRRFQLGEQNADAPNLTTLRRMSAGVLRGRCGCNAIAYEVADEFVVAYNCHCSNCRAMTGSAFLPWGEIEPEKLRVTSGTGGLIVVGDPEGHHATRCDECFSLLYWTGDEGKIRVPYGSLIDAPALVPTAHMFVGSKASWYEINDDLLQYDESPWG